MKISTIGNITTVTLSFEEWEKKPFPQVIPLLIDHITRYHITGIPANKIHLFDGMDEITTCLN